MTDSGPAQVAAAASLSSLAFVASLVLAVLNLAGVTHLSWWIVAAPLLVSIGLSALLAVLGLLAFLFIAAAIASSTVFRGIKR